jgi:ribosome maturation factor RimP
LDLRPLQPLFEAQLSLLGYELVYFEVAKQGRDNILRLYVDHLDAGRTGRKVTLDDCVAVNEGLLPWIEVEFPDIRDKMGLEISSPGLERPLAKLDHFRRFAGSLCRIQTARPLNGQKRFKGWIGGTGDGTVTIEEDGILKVIPLAEIQKAHLAPFDEEKTPQPRHVAARSAALPQDVGAETSAVTEV